MIKFPIKIAKAISERKRNTPIYFEWTISHRVYGSTFIKILASAFSSNEKALMIKAILNKTPTKIDPRPRNKATNKNGSTSISVFFSKIKSFRIKLSILPLPFLRIKHNILQCRLLDYSHLPEDIFCSRFVGSQRLKATIGFSDGYKFPFRIPVKQLDSTF